MSKVDLKCKLSFVLALVMSILAMTSIGSVAHAQWRIYIFAHRGAALYYPENTIAAFEKAIELGANALEIDLALTGCVPGTGEVEGSLIVFHPYAWKEALGLKALWMLSSYPYGTEPQLVKLGLEGPLSYPYPQDPLIWLSIPKTLTGTAELKKEIANLMTKDETITILAEMHEITMDVIAWKNENDPFFRNVKGNFDLKDEKYHVITFSRFLKWLKEHPQIQLVYLDVKFDPDHPAVKGLTEIEGYTLYAKKIAQELKAADLTDRCLISIPKPELLDATVFEEVRKVNPSVKFVVDGIRMKELINSPVYKKYQENIVAISYSSGYTNPVTINIPIVGRLLGQDYNELMVKLVNKIREDSQDRGGEGKYPMIIAWTINDSRVIDECIKAGVDGLITDPFIDLMIKRLDVKQEECSWDATITVEVRNIGNTFAKDVGIGLWVSGWSLSPEPSSQGIPPYTPYVFDSAAFQAKWHIGDYGTYRLTAWADAERRIQEVKENNNEVSIDVMVKEVCYEKKWVCDKWVQYCWDECVRWEKINQEERCVEWERKCKEECEKGHNECVKYCPQVSIMY